MPPDPWRQALVEFGRKLRDLREEAGLTQVALARQIGRSDSTLSTLELGAGTRVPSQELVTPYIHRCIECWTADKALKDERRAALLLEHRQLARLREMMDTLHGQVAQVETFAPAPGASPPQPVTHELAESLLVFINSVGGKSASPILSMNWNLGDLAHNAIANARLDYLGPQVEVVVHDGILIVFSGKLNESVIVASIIGTLDKLVRDYEARRNLFHPRLQVRMVIDRGPARPTDTGLIGPGFDDLSVVTQLPAVRDMLAADEGVDVIVVIADSVFSRLQASRPAHFDISEFVPSMHFQEALSGPKGMWTRLPGYKCRADKLPTPAEFLAMVKRFDQVTFTNGENDNGAPSSTMNT